MSWIIESKTSKERALPLVMDAETLRHFHSEVREERRFWFDRSIAYANFYAMLISALLSAFVVGMTQINTLGQYRYTLVLFPTLSALLCGYAKRVLRICYRQFLENTTIMAKIEALMGIYKPIEVSSVESFPFPDDMFLNPERYYENMKRFTSSRDFVENDLRQPNRTYAIVARVFTVVEMLSVFIAIVFLSVEVYSLIR